MLTVFTHVHVLSGDHDPCFKEEDQKWHRNLFRKGYYFERLIFSSRTDKPLFSQQMLKLKQTAHISDPIMIPIIQCSYHIGSIKTQLTGVIWNLIQLHYCPNPVGIITNHFTEKQRKAKLWLCSPRHGNISQCSESFNQSLQPSLVCLVGENAHQSITGSALIAKFPCLWNLLEHFW